MAMLSVLVLNFWRPRGSASLPRVFFFILLLGVPLISLGIYATIGSSADLTIRERLVDLAQRAGNGEDLSTREQRDLVELIERRAEQTQKPEYWYLMANQLMELEDYQRAAESYARASELLPDDVFFKASQAEAAYLAAGGRLTSEVMALIDEIRSSDPENITVNRLLGLAAFQIGEWRLAIDYWTKVVDKLPPMAPEAQLYRSSIEVAQQRLGEPQGQQSNGEPAAQPAAQGVELMVNLDSQLTFPPSTSVFIFARAANGAAVPLAVKRVQVADLPLAVTLSDADAMLENMRLSLFEQIDVVARVSPSGSPTPAPGDYEARIENVIWSELMAPLELVIAEPIE